ncbi:MAG: hypothetical protein ABSF29_08125 [Tepidisphaeraceae bacterium]|jgi:hypothetical protein
MEPKTSGKADAWRKHIAAQQASGQSVRAWCRQNDCAEHAFYWWRAKVGQTTLSELGQFMPDAWRAEEQVVSPAQN